MLQSKNNKKSAVFLDQGGTLLDDFHHSFDTVTTEDFFPDVFEALRKLQCKYRLFIVTNQSSVGLGRISQAKAQAFNDMVNKVLKNAGIEIVETFACMHKRDDMCLCIKPNPFFIQKAQKKYNLDLKRSFVIGDHPHDVKFAENSGLKGLYVLTGHGEKHRNELPDNVSIFPTVLDAARYVCSTDEEFYKQG